MKKLTLLFILAFAGIVIAFGQTYYYTCIESVDKNGAKSKGDGGNYITFINNKNALYVSDKNGYKENNNSATFYFQGTNSNGIHEYCFMRSTIDYNSGFPWKNKYTPDRNMMVFYFSSDLQRLNYVWLGTTYVYMQGGSPEETNIPKQLY